MTKRTSTKQQNNTNKKYIGKFLRIFFMVFIIAILLMGILTVGYSLIINDGVDEEAITKNPNSTNNGESSDDLEAETNQGTDNEKKITTIAIFGTDKEGYRTDVIMLAFFNRETMAVDIISVPRDTYITLPEDIYKRLKEKRSDTPESLRINEVPAHEDKLLRNETSVEVMEAVFGIDIDYYIGLNLKGFVAIVDLVGPIIMDIPNDMKYIDTFQDLYIDIDKGDNQEINGTQAEGIIRYRAGYASGDIGRIDMQHQFMTAFLDKLLTMENRLNIVNIATTALLYMDTDFTDAIDYVNYIDDIDTSLITMTRLPGAAMTNSAYYGFDYEETKLLLNQIINYDEVIESVDETENLEPVEVIEPVEIIDTKILSISIQNGTYVSGLAGRTKKALETEGYTVYNAVNYENSPVERTKIMATRLDVAEEIAAFFKDPEIEIVESFANAEIEIVVILGGTDGETY